MGVLSHDRKVRCADRPGARGRARPSSGGKHPGRFCCRPWRFQGAHHWNQKTVFYEESVRVPLILKLPSVVKPAISDRLVNTGVDLLPTLCGVAGIQPAEPMPGMNLMGTATGRVRHDPRSYVVSSNHMTQGAPVDGKIHKPRGRMVRSQRYKYCVYDQGKHRESLVDLAHDPGEMVNIADQPQAQETL